MSFSPRITCQKSRWRGQIRSKATCSDTPLTFTWLAIAYSIEARRLTIEVATAGRLASSCSGGHPGVLSNISGSGAEHSWHRSAAQPGGAAGLRSPLGSHAYTPTTTR